MAPWLATLLAPSLATGVASLFGGTTSKQKTSSTTDPFYALMSPYAIGMLLQRMGGLSNAGFPEGALGSMGGMIPDLGGDIWKVIQRSWPKIKAGLNIENNVRSGALTQPK